MDVQYVPNHNPQSETLSAYYMSNIGCVILLV